MPTPAKLVCAVLFAALCWYTADLIIRIAMSEGAAAGRFREWLAGGGLLVGWFFVGKRASGSTNQGASVSLSITAGIGGALIIMLLGLLLNSFVTMISLSFGSVYTELGQAIDAWIGFLFQDLRAIAHPIIFATFFGGAAAAGLIGGIVGRIFR
jgi:hypothetical protein